MNAPRRPRRSRGRGRRRPPRKQGGRGERAPRRERQRRTDPELPELLAIDEIGERLETVLAESPADETEVVWLEVSRGEATRRGKRAEVRISPERTILVRVLDLGRVGSYRTGSGEPAALADAVRQAMAHSRVREPLSGLPHLPAENEPIETSNGLHDPDVASLTPGRARDLLESLPLEGGELQLHWAESRVVVYNSRKIRRRAEVTGVAFEARCGEGAGSGYAADAARRLEDLNPARILEIAKDRQTTADTIDLPAESVPLVLAPEAVISLVEMLNQESFSAKAYYDGTSFLREHLGVQVFDRALTLTDDATDHSGIPFPFDLEGTAKRPVPLILEGAPKTPALDQRQAAVLGLPPTAHAIGGNDARAQNVFLVAGELDDEELLATADGGLWIGWLDHLECREPNRVQFNARARGVRRIEGGRLGAPLADFFWEDSLLRAFSSILGIGSVTTNRLTRDGYLGGFCAPAVAIGSVEGLSSS